MQVRGIVKELTVSVVINALNTYLWKKQSQVHLNRDSVRLHSGHLNEMLRSPVLTTCIFVPQQGQVKSSDPIELWPMYLLEFKMDKRLIIFFANFAHGSGT